MKTLIPLKAINR